MVGETLCGIFLLLMAAKLYTGRRKPKHYEFSVKFGSHSLYDTFCNAYDGMKNKLPVVSEPLAKICGINLLNNHLILDAELARDLLSTDKIQSHGEITSFFDLVFQYRELRGDSGAGKMKSTELGLMRDMDREKPASTQVMKQSRKRFLEFTSSLRQAKSNLARIRHEARLLVEQALTLAKKGPFDPKMIAMDAGTNVGFATATGFSLEQGTEKLRKMSETIQYNTHGGVAPEPYKLLFLILPRWVRRLIPLKYWPKFLSQANPMWDYVIELVDKHFRNYDPEDEPCTLLDTMASDYNLGVFTYSDIVVTVYAMMIGGADTTGQATTFVWLSLARHPEWQERCYKEARDKNFDVERISDLPLLNAFIHETLRWNPILMYSLLHTSTVPVEVGGYNFSRGTTFSYAQGAFWMSEQYWVDPFKFNPLRFIGNGRFVPNKNLMLFGYGRRSCPGRALAEQQILQYTVEFLRNCTAQSDPKNPLLIVNTEEEWRELFDKSSVTKPKVTLVQLKNQKLLVKARPQT